LYSYPTCADLKIFGLNSHLKCYERPDPQHTEVSIRNLPYQDLKRILSEANIYGENSKWPKVIEKGFEWVSESQWQGLLSAEESLI